MTLNDAILAATGGPTINDGLSLWYGRLDDETINDAEYRWLTEQGSPPTHINDMWLQFLRSQGYTGALNDMLYAYWVDRAAGPVTPPPNLLVNSRWSDASGSIGGADFVIPTGWGQGFWPPSDAIAQAAIDGNIPIQFQVTADRGYLTFDLSGSATEGQRFNVSCFVEDVAIQSPQRIIHVSGDAVQVSNNSQNLPVGFQGRVSAVYEIVAPASNVQIRIGTGTTAATDYDVTVSRPQATAGELLWPYQPTDTPIVVTPQQLTVGQFSNVNKRGYRRGQFGSLDGATAVFDVDELLVNNGTGKLVLRGADIGGFMKVNIDGVDYLKGDAIFDGFDTWRWPMPSFWNVGTIRVVLFS